MPKAASLVPGGPVIQTHSVCFSGSCSCCRTSLPLGKPAPLMVRWMAQLSLCPVFRMKKSFFSLENTQVLTAGILMGMIHDHHLQPADVTIPSERTESSGQSSRTVKSAQCVETLGSSLTCYMAQANSRLSRRCSPGLL